MKRGRRWLLAGAVMVAVPVAASQFIYKIPASVSNPIAADRQSPYWSSAGAGTIPARATQCGSTITAYSGTAGTINTAIQSCTAGQHVQLGSGTFTLSTGITFVGKSDVTLRGNGPNSTFVNFVGSPNAYDACDGLLAFICIKPTYITDVPNPNVTTTWDAHYTQGTTVVTLGSVAFLAANSQIVFDRLADSTTDPGREWIAGNNNAFIDIACSSCGSGTGRTGRPQQFITSVVSISGNDVTIADPIIGTNWSSGSPGAYWAWELGANPSPNIRNDGVEDMSLDYHLGSPGTGALAIGGINFIFARDSWVKNVRSLNHTSGDMRAQIRFVHSAHITVRDSYFYGVAGSTGNYGIESYMTTSNLVENNVMVCFTAGLTHDATIGTVDAYNYTTNNCYTNENWVQPTIYFHGPGNAYILEEGNDVNSTIQDDIHGTANFITFFRNRIAGWENGKTLQTVAFHNYAFSRYANVVGNVLGMSGYHTRYSWVAGTDASNSTNCYSAVYGLGWFGNCVSGTGPNDSIVDNTMMRWGNYDIVNASNQFVSGEVPSGDSYWPNSVPANNNLPNSLYRSSQPSGWWTTPWGTPPWPPIGPDATGGQETNVGGHNNSIPAKLCWENSAIDSGYAVSKSVTAGSYGSGLAQLTIGAHSFTKGGSVKISGVSPSGYNGTFLIYAVTGTTISYGLLSSPGSYTSGGTAEQPTIQTFSGCYS